MTTTLRHQKPLNRWANDRIQPGSVGSVGDVLGQVRVKQSSPDMPFAWDSIFSGADEPFRGSNVQNGTIGSWTSDGMAAKTLDGLWDGRRSFKTSYGWLHQVSSFLLRTFPLQIKWLRQYSSLNLHIHGSIGKLK